MGSAWSREAAAKERSDTIDRSLLECKRKSRRTYKLLLLGSKESGKGTVVEQMKFIGDEGHFWQEREQFKSLIGLYRSIMHAMITIIRTMDQLRISFGQEECAEDARKLFTLAENYGYSSHKSGDHSHEFALIMTRLWNDSGVQEGFAR